MEAALEISKSKYLFLVIIFLSFSNTCIQARKLFSLYEPPPIALTYHDGALLEGEINVSIFWYGKFSPAQKSIILDFLSSLNHAGQINVQSLKTSPLVSQWWQKVESYVKRAGKKNTHVVLGEQISDENCSTGKNLKKSQINELAHRVNSVPGGLALVLTAENVAVEGFCMSECGYHGWKLQKEDSSAFIWVGNSVSQCPGQCAWPFHQPIYGPQAEPLGAPNGDVGVDGMVVNIATLMAGAVTNPYGNGYYQGSAGAPLEVASACSGVYGKGAYPGYAGELLMDKSTGASFNAQGTNGRKYLLPAIFDLTTSDCSTIII